jgi:hypothetical protein
VAAGHDDFMQPTPDQVRQGQPPKLTEPIINGLPTDSELELLRQQRIRFDGFFTGPTW